MTAADLLRAAGQALACVLVVLTFLAARRLSAHLGNPPWASPVLVAALAVGGLLWAAGVPLGQFRAATAPLGWALGPALVGLGAVIWRGRALIAAQPGPLFVAVAGGTSVGVLSAVGLARALGLGPLLTAGLATKTLTTPFAVAIAEHSGGPVPLAAALAVLTGVIGAVIVPPLLRLARFKGSAVSGVAIGQAAHLVGTDWLTRRDARAAAWSSVTIVLAGILASLALPPLWRWVVLGG